MEILARLFLLAAVVALVVAVVLAGVGGTVVATANGWLDLSLVCAVLAIAVGAVFGKRENKTDS